MAHPSITTMDFNNIIIIISKRNNSNIASISNNVASISKVNSNANTNVNSNANSKANSIRNTNTRSLQEFPECNICFANGEVLRLDNPEQLIQTDPSTVVTCKDVAQAGWMGLLSPEVWKGVSW
jgi:hypothetical protein